jgi:hypothetical protein
MMPMMRLVAPLTLLTLAILFVGAGSTIVVSGQLLAYQDGFVFFTTGDGFRVAPDIVLRDAQTGGATTIRPAPRIWARATFNAAGTVTELDLSRSPLPPQGSFADVARFAVALSTPAPNPDLIPNGAPAPEPGVTIPPGAHFSGMPVLVTFIVQVPPNTPLTSTIYITTDASGWNAQAIPMDRTDAMHYQITRRINSGTIFRYLYDRGSFQSAEVAQNGLSRAPRAFVVEDADVLTRRDSVYGWQDSISSGASQPQPQVMPTPYNPAPFPNLPPGLPPPQPPAPGKPPAQVSR